MSPSNSSNMKINNFRAPSVSQLQSFTNVRSGVSRRLYNAGYDIWALARIPLYSIQYLCFWNPDLLRTTEFDHPWDVLELTIVTRLKMPYGEWIGLWSSTGVISRLLSQVNVRPGCPSGTTPQSSSVNRCHANNRTRKRGKSSAKLKPEV